MMNYGWNSLYFGWGWIFWLGFIFLIFSSFGNWGYTYRAHQKYGGRPENKVFDILDERYARGDINREQYRQIKLDIANSPDGRTGDEDVASSKIVRNN